MRYEVSDMLEFVTITHPDQIKARKIQRAIRQRAISNGIMRRRGEQAEKLENFVAVTVHRKTKQPAEKITPPVTAVARAPSVSLMDPFHTLCGSPERLRCLMRHPSAKQVGEPVFCIDGSGIAIFQGIATTLEGALADPTFFHALSLVLSLAANNSLPNLETLTHRGRVLNSLCTAMENPNWTPKVSTVTAMLILIGYEYRVQGADPASVAAHIRGVQASMKTWDAQYLPLVIKVQRALFWQDLISCLVIGTPRLLSHKDYDGFQSLRDIGHLDLCVVPSGFLPVIHLWPSEFAVVLEDLNALCCFVDVRYRTEPTPTKMFGGVLLMAELDDEGYPVDNSQANLESRLVDLLSESRRVPAFVDPIYEACIFAAYLCTYKLSTGVWEGCFVPEVCVSQILQRITVSDPRWKLAPGLLLWLLFVSGGLTEKRDIRTQVAVLVKSVYGDLLKGLPCDWRLLQDLFKNFIWSTCSIEGKVFRVWKELYPELVVRPSGP